MSEIRHIPYNSTYLNKQMALAVYLPDEYKYGSKFPVLYFLHGRSGDESFIEQLGLAQLTDSLIAASTLKEHAGLIGACLMARSKYLND